MIQLKTNSKKKKAKKAAPYVRRTLQDERVHRHLSDAAEGLRKAYSRAARQPGAKAVEDKKLYGHVRAAAASLSAALGIVRQPEPKKVAARRGGDGARDYSSARPSEPVEPARAAQAA